MDNVSIIHYEMSTRKCRPCIRDCLQDCNYADLDAFFFSVRIYVTVINPAIKYINHAA
jgi:hypothetical protein